jgi:hypothetical protein
VDDFRIDALTRVLGGVRSRRALLGLVAALGLGRLDHADAKKKRKKRKKKKKPCAKTCAGCCTRKACKAGTSAAACGSDGETCAACDAGQTCQDGRCVTLPCGEGGPCLVFVTSANYGSNLNGLTGADNLCQTAANNAMPAPLPGSYKAWLADSSGSPSTRFVQSTGPYRLVNGTTIAANWADLTDGTLAARINFTEHKTAVGELFKTWTSVQKNGTLAESGYSCKGWKSNLITELGGTGSSRSSSAAWTLDAYETCSQLRRLYCFQQS